MLESPEMSRLFVSQELLDQWSGEGKIELEGSVLKLIHEGRFFEIQPGVRFVRVAAGEDRQKLNCKVKTEAQMNALGAELYMNSVLVGEDAYDVQTGFLCDVPTIAAAGLAAEDASKAAADAVPKGAPKTADERSMLAQFLLENLS
jgi:hypothetical protein